MFKIIKFTFFYLILIKLSSCKSENKSEVDKYTVPTLIAKILTKEGIKELLPAYEKYSNILGETFVITSVASKNGRNITIPRLYDSSQELLAQPDWLFNFLNPNSPWRDDYKGPLKTRFISEFSEGRSIDYIITNTVRGDSNLEELIDFDLATSPTANTSQRLGLYAQKNQGGKRVTSLIMPDAALLNTNIKDMNNELLFRGMSSKDLILELPSQMVEKEIRSRNPQEYLSNLANQGVFELDQEIGTPYNLSKPLYRVHEVLGISQEIYAQNRELAKRSLQYMSFLQNYIKNKSTTKDQKAVAKYCLDKFTKTVRSIIDGNLKNAGKVEYFITHPKMAGAFFSEDYILRDYIRSLYDSSYFNRPLNVALKGLFPKSEMIGKFKDEETMIILNQQIDQFAKAYPDSQKPIMASVEDSEDIFARSKERKKLLDQYILQPYQR